MSKKKQDRALMLEASAAFEFLLPGASERNGGWRARLTDSERITWHAIRWVAKGSVKFFRTYNRWPDLTNHVDIVEALFLEVPLSPPAIFDAVTDILLSSGGVDIRRAEDLEPERLDAAAMAAGGLG